MPQTFVFSSPAGLPFIDPNGALRRWLAWWWPPLDEDQHGADLPGPEEITLRDGTAAWIRPLTPADRELHAAGYKTLSSESKFHRFLTPMPNLSPQLLDQLVDGVDGVDHIAYYVFVDGQESALPVAVGRIVRDPDHPDTADIAVTVQDACQGRGIATALLRILVARRPEGVVRLLTLVDEDNEASLAMLKNLGPHTMTLRGGVYEVRVNLVGEDVDQLAELPEQDPPADWRVKLRARDFVCPWGA
ncbi:MAG: GNAT family N-acetyltransferase [Propionibacteriaceae bacterium]|nr:GNAT family N-acetyltransferase [Propionibacteriaceae bacterium]